jgi:hypothetical protein
MVTGKKELGFLERKKAFVAVGGQSAALKLLVWSIGWRGDVGSHRFMGRTRRRKASFNGLRSLYTGMVHMLRNGLIILTKGVCW